MAVVKEFNYSVVVTVNMGNYESVKVEVGETVEMEPLDTKDNYEDAKKALVKRVTKLANAEADKLRAKRDSEKY